jgi:hypothetical protein
MRKVSIKPTQQKEGHYGGNNIVEVADDSNQKI